MSNKYSMVSRLDRPDWKEVMAGGHPGGMRWVNLLGTGAADHYRRCYSKDTLEIDPAVYKLVKRAGSGGGWGNLDEYRPLIEPHEPRNPFRTRMRKLCLNT